MKIKKETWIRTAVLAFALVNQMLTVAGKNPLPFSEEEAYTGLSTILTVVSAIVAWWKNNSFTDEAMKADEYMKELKNGKSD